jgi:hypothetical protein
MKTSDSHPLWMICTWALLPSSTACKLPHMHSAWSEHKYICQDLCLVELASVGKAPVSSYIAQPSHILQAFCSLGNLSNCIVPGANAAISAATQGDFLWILKL